MGGNEGCWLVHIMEDLALWIHNDTSKISGLISCCFCGEQQTLGTGLIVEFSDHFGDGEIPADVCIKDKDGRWISFE